VILVDTDVLIANLRGIDAARDWLRDARARTGRLAVSVVTNAEIIGVMRSPERREVTRLLNSLRPLPVTDMIAHRPGELRRHYRRSHAAISLVDYLIAATAAARPRARHAQHQALPDVRRPEATFPALSRSSSACHVPDRPVRPTRSALTCQSRAATASS
jgi:predicted nucleic acid-binding protein